MKKLLIVDDNEQNRYMLQVLLSANGFKVELASNGVEALEQARRTPPDLVVSDILMPQMDGFALCRAWKEDQDLKKIPFAFYTATYTDPKDEDFALSLGAERFMIKPMEPEKFLAQLQEIFDTFKEGKLLAQRQPAGEQEFYKNYNATLIRKLENKVLQLEESKRALELDIAERKLAEEALNENKQNLLSFMNNSPDTIYLIDLHDQKPHYLNREEFCGYSKSELEAPGSIMYALHQDDAVEVQLNWQQLLCALDNSVSSVDYRLKKKDGDWEWIHQRGIVLTRETDGTPRQLLITLSIITARKQAEEGLARQTEELSRLYRASGSLLAESPFDVQALFQTILRTVNEEFGQSNSSLFLIDEDADKLTPVASAGSYVDQLTKIEQTVDGPGLIPLSIRTKQCINTPDVHANPAYLAGWEMARSELTIPLKIGDRVIGAIDVQSSQPAAYSADDERLMTIFAERAALALEHARLYSQTERRLENLTGLRAIDMAIASSFDINFTLGILLNQVMKQLSSDAADVLVFNPATQTLQISAVQGFRSSGFEKSTVRLGDGYARQVIRERRVLTVENLDLNPGQEPRIAEMVREGFVSYTGAPLIAKGLVKGVLEIFQRGPINLNREQRNFLDLLSGQAAIAIDSAQLFENLQNSNTELMMAYDETIEGWSQAMDLRDSDTEGHSRRVTELTVKIAVAFGCTSDELVHIHRGALLHDIGKLGVPDEILRKSGPLTPDEWVSMKKHPQFAYDMLFPISHLRPALDIPYCHHEKWDGTGYPRGLKEDQIPLVARIFAVVDVWDALSSNRPYRQAWPQEKVRAYIQEQSGKHFDPRVVSVFLREITIN